MELIVSAEIQKSLGQVQLTYGLACVLCFKLSETKHTDITIYIMPITVC